MTANVCRFLLTLIISLGILTQQGSAVEPQSHTGDVGRSQTLYVSKLGDDSDGRSWEKAFHTIQSALSDVSNDQGGHKIVVRPDIYLEANLAPAHQGAAGAYNLLIGDFDGSLGSGAKGWVTIDSGDPDLGFKSWDWWCTMRSSDKHWPHGNNQETFSSIVWDRWTFGNLYVTGADAGLFFDLTDRSGEGFTVIVEDCVGIGRAFGGGVVYPKVRPGEPSVFRRSYFLALDWVGDSAAFLVGGREQEMPAEPHVVVEDCTLVHCDNAIAMSYASDCARIKLIDCRMIVLNFTQPEMGGKSTGILCTQGHAASGRLHVDLQDCSMAGYSLFTTGADAQALSYTTKGKVQAYVQFKQSIPADFQRLGQWPVELFSQIAPPRSPDDLKGTPADP